MIKGVSEQAQDLPIGAAGEQLEFVVLIGTIDIPGRETSSYTEYTV